MKMSGLLLPFGLLFCALTGSSTAQVEEECNFYSDIRDGKEYYIFNPEYPNYYYRPHSCKWTAKSVGRVHLNCTLEMPQNPDCGMDAITILVNNNATYRYCGQGEFNLRLPGPNLTVLFRSDRYTAGGKFLCQMQQIPEEVPDTCKCGWSNPRRIVGGTETGVNEYPFMAGLVHLQNRQLYCGGTIISQKHVMTAAHCVIDINVNLLGVVVGEHDISTGKDTNATQLFRVELVTIHRQYSATARDSDVAVIKIVGVIVFSPEVGPICLPFQHRFDSFGGLSVTALGWGTDEFGGATSDVLQEVKLQVITMKKCSISYPNITSNSICTFADGKDACQFDSGGPLSWFNPGTKRWVSVGIISSGRGCAGDTPGINVRVGQFVEWIKFVTRVTFCEEE